MIFLIKKTFHWQKILISLRYYQSFINNYPKNYSVILIFVILTMSLPIHYVACLVFSEGLRWFFFIVQCWNYLYRFDHCFSLYIFPASLRYILHLVVSLKMFDLSDERQSNIISWHLFFSNVIFLLTYNWREIIYCL